MTAGLADLHFAPTETSGNNLLAEGVPAENVFVTGNTVIDALLWMAERGHGDPLPPPVRQARTRGKKIILVTGHRRESYEAVFENICEGILAVSRRRDYVFFIYPVHFNPQVRGPVFSLLGDNPNICLIDPVPYKTFVALMRAAYCILTDSGGVQEEAPALGKAVLVMRGVTERPEGVAAGGTLLVGTRAKSIAAGVNRVLDEQGLHASMSVARFPYGDGRGAEHIARILERRLLRDREES